MGQTMAWNTLWILALCQVAQRCGEYSISWCLHLSQVFHFRRKAGSTSANTAPEFTVHNCILGWHCASPRHLHASLFSMEMQGKHTKIHYFPTKILGPPHIGNDSAEIGGGFYISFHPTPIYWKMTNKTWSLKSCSGRPKRKENKNFKLELELCGFFNCAWPVILHKFNFDNQFWACHPYTLV